MTRRGRAVVEGLDGLRQGQIQLGFGAGADDVLGGFRLVSLTTLTASPTR